MKSIALIAHTANAYGASHCIVELACTLKEGGHAPYVFIPEEGPIETLLKKTNIPYAITPIPLWASFPWELSDSFFQQAYGRLCWKASRLKSLLSLRRHACTLASALRANKIDLVWSNSVMTPIGSMAARQCSLPHIWHLREFGDLDFKYRFDLGLGLTQRFLKKSGPTISMSHAIARHFKLENAKDGSKHAVIYDGLFSEKQLLHKPAPAPLNPQKFEYLLTGALCEGKGQKEAMQALRIVVRSFPKTHLHLIGDGDMRELKYLADNLGLSNNITFWGYQENISEYLAKANAGLMCSRNEGFGRVTLEYMAAGIPVIGYKGGATPEIIESGKTGLLYTGGCEQLADCMLRLIKNPDLAQNLGNAGQESIRERFTFEKSGPQLLAFLDHNFGTRV